MESLRLDRFGTYLEYEAAFESVSTTLEFAGVNTYASDEDKLYMLCKGLDDTLKTYKELVQATTMSYTDAKAYFQKVAKSNQSISGTSLTSAKKRSVTDRVHATQDSRQQQACKLFAKGSCSYGSKCKYQHGNTNTGSEGSSSKRTGGTTDQEQRKCKCGATIKGPRFWKKCGACHKKSQEGAQKHTANATVEQSAGQSNPSAQSGAVESLTGFTCYAAQAPEIVSIDSAHASVALVTQQGASDGSILFAIDSAATVGIVEDDA